MRGLRILVAALVGAAVAGPAVADGPGSRPRLSLVPATTTPTPAPPAAPAEARTVAPPTQEASVTPPPAATASRSSAVELPGGLTAALPASLTFYPAPEAQGYMSRIGAAPPPGQVAGMIAPAGRKPADEDFWAAIVTYENVGYVPETGTAALAAPSFVTDVREARGQTAPRLEEFPVAPTYVAASDRLIWGERVTPTAGQTRPVTLSQRLLGREGVAKLDAHLRPEQLEEAQRLAGPMIAALSFAEGKTHADFTAGDRQARFDVPGLITGRMSAVGATAAVASVSPEDGGGGGLPGWAPWAAIGAAVAGAVSWLAFLMRRNRDTIDPNLTPN